MDATIASLMPAYASNYTATPAVILNPAALPLDVLAWCLAELQALHTWADLMSCARADIQVEPREVAQLFTARSRPIVDMMTHAMDAIAAQK